MRITNRGAAVAIAGAFVAGIAVAAPFASGAAAQSDPSVYTTTAAVWCADAIMEDLDAASEGQYNVPTPKWEWVLAACNGEPHTTGSYGGIYMYEDGSYLIEGYGDPWIGSIG